MFQPSTTTNNYSAHPKHLDSARDLTITSVLEHRLEPQHEPKEQSSNRISRMAWWVSGFHLYTTLQVMSLWLKLHIMLKEAT